MNKRKRFLGLLLGFILSTPLIHYVIMDILERQYEKALNAPENMSENEELEDVYEEAASYYTTISLSNLANGIVRYLTYLDLDIRLKIDKDIARPIIIKKDDVEEIHTFLDKKSLFLADPRDLKNADGYVAISIDFNNNDNRYLNINQEHNTHNIPVSTIVKCAKEVIKVIKYCNGNELDVMDVAEDIVLFSSEYSKRTYGSGLTDNEMNIIMLEARKLLNDEVILENGKSPKTFNLL